MNIEIEIKCCTTFISHWDYASQAPVTFEWYASSIRSTSYRTERTYIKFSLFNFFISYKPEIQLLIGICGLN